MRSIIVASVAALALLSNARIYKKEFEEPCDNKLDCGNGHCLDNTCYYMCLKDSHCLRFGEDSLCIENSCTMDQPNGDIDTVNKNPAKFGGNTIDPEEQEEEEFPEVR